MLLVLCFPFLAVVHVFRANGRSRVECDRHQHEAKSSLRKNVLVGRLWGSTQRAGVYLRIVSGLLLRLSGCGALCGERGSHSSLDDRLRDPARTRQPSPLGSPVQITGASIEIPYSSPLRTQSLIFVT